VPALVVPPALYRRTALPRLVRAGVAMAFRPGAVRRAVERVYGLVVILGKPKSRGTVRLGGADPRMQADIDPAYFSDPEDMAAMIAGVRLAREVAAGAGLRDWAGPELLPGRWARSDLAIARFVRRMVMTTYHYAGTCRMGQVPGSV